MRNNVSKLHDQKTFNLGQIHSVMRVIYQESQPIAKIKEEKAPRVDLCLPSRTLLLPCFTFQPVTAPWPLECPPHPHRTTWKWDSTFQTMEPQEQHQPSRKGLGSTKVVTSLPSTRGSSDATAALRVASSKGQPGCSAETPGAMGTEDIIYHLVLTGLQEEENLENRKHPMVQGTPCPNIILRQAFPALLHGSGALPCPGGGSPCHPHQSIQPSQVTSDPAKEHTDLTGNGRLTTQETHKYLGARTSRCFVT